MFLLEVTKVLHDFKVPYALVGGWAVALHGFERGTYDVDLVVTLDAKNLLHCEKALNSLGLKSRLPITAQDVAQFREEYVSNRHLIAWSFVDSNNPFRLVDVLLTENLLECEVETKVIGKQKVQLVSFDDLIRMKKKSDRPQDRADVKALLKVKKE